MADTKISALTAASEAATANEFAINEAGTSKKLTMEQIADYIYKNGAGTTIACGRHITALVLAANSADITGTGLTTVMSVTGVDVGRYFFRCALVYQASATTTGIDVAVNHTGTTTQFLVQHLFCSTATTQATAAAAMNQTAGTGNVYEGQATGTKNAIIGAGTVSVDTANADMLSIIEGMFVVSVTGTFEIKLAAETAALVVRAMQGSYLELNRLS